jgi:hypothetical protein
MHVRVGCDRSLVGKWTAKRPAHSLVGRVVQNEILYTVIPAKAGIQGRSMCGQVWMPAFAGMTLVSPRRTAPHFERRPEIAEMQVRRPPSKKPRVAPQ